MDELKSEMNGDGLEVSGILSEVKAKCDGNEVSEVEVSRDEGSAETSMFDQNGVSAEGSICIKNDEAAQDGAVSAAEINERAAVECDDDKAADSAATNSAAKDMADVESNNEGNAMDCDVNAVESKNEGTALDGVAAVKNEGTVECDGDKAEDSAVKNEAAMDCDGKGVAALELKNEGAAMDGDQELVLSAEDAEDEGVKIESVYSLSQMEVEEDKTDELKNLRCFKCTETFTERPALYTHLRTHLNKKVYICDEQCGTAMDINEHIEKMHSNDLQCASKVRKFYCIFCGYLCQPSNSMVVHMRTHTNMKPFKCDKCDYSCRTRFGLKRHEETHSPKEEVKKVDETTEKKYKCPQCEFSTLRLKALKSHCLMHEYRSSMKKKKERFACQQCDYSCTTESALSSHIRTHGSFDCDQCDFCGPSLLVLNRHKRIHTGEKPFQCEVCDYGSWDSNSLKLHQRVHTGERPYSCNLCDYKSARSTSLKIHMRMHTGEKPYKCDHCEYRSSNKSGLKSHSMMHTGEKPFCCSQCDYKCSSSGSLKRHSIVHDKTPTCPFCNLVFPTQSVLRLHLNSHMPQKNLVCPDFECDFTTTSFGSLKLHLKTHEQSRSFTCHICGLVCFDASYLNKHLKEVHRFPTEIVIRKAILECDECDFKTKSESEMKDHTQHHMNENHFVSILNPEVKLEIVP